MKQDFTNEELLQISDAILGYQYSLQATMSMIYGYEVQQPIREMADKLADLNVRVCSFIEEGVY